MKTAIIFSVMFLAFAVFYYMKGENHSYAINIIISQIWTATAAILIELNKQRRDR